MSEFRDKAYRAAKLADERADRINELEAQLAASQDIIRRMLRSEAVQEAMRVTASQDLLDELPLDIQHSEPDRGGE